MAMIKTLIALSVCTLTLAACGGGGGGGSASRADPPMMQPQAQKPTQKPASPMQPKTQPQTQKPTQKPASPIQPKKPTQEKTADYTQGTPSSLKNAQDALNKLRLNGGALNGVQEQIRPTDVFITVTNPLEEPNNEPNNDPTDFTPVSGLDLSLLPIAAQDTKAKEAWQNGWTGKGVKTAIVDDFTRTHRTLQQPHGTMVRAVAWQIAPEADMGAYHIDLQFSATVENGIDTIYGRAATAFAKAEAEDAHIVNASFGVDPYTFRSRPANINLSAYAARLLQQPGFTKIIAPATDTTGYHADMLFVFAAGNGARQCQKRTLDSCTIDGTALLKRRETEPQAGDRLIFVGSLADDGNDMADYSYTAGKLQNDFIVAHDDIWQRADGAGTSFAAPRVTGAAALVRHKFPNLNGPQLKQVLLQTADDLGVKGVDETFGYGKLNVLGALSPIGGLTR